jgi:hypothetical protein
MNLTLLIILAVLVVYVATCIYQFRKLSRGEKEERKTS